MATIQNLLSLDPTEVSKMSRAELAQTITKVGNTLNRRIKALEGAGGESPALRSIQKSGGRITARGKNLNQLRAEYFRAKGFYEMKTSTKSGWDKVKKQQANMLSKKLGFSISPENEKEFWKTFNLWKELDPGLFLNKKYEIEVLYNMIQDFKSQGIVDNDTLAIMLSEKVRDLYEQNELSEYNDTGFFEL